MSGFYCEGEPYRGARTKVFAYLGRPSAGTASRGAVVLVHGAGGRAYSEWVSMWVQRGYVAIAVDLGWAGIDGIPHAFAGPSADDNGKFFSIADGAESTWMFHAVAAVLRAVSIVRDEPDVDPERIFLNGISWGAHVAQLAASIDPRIRRSAFVYGAGFLGAASPVASALGDMDPVLAEQWIAEFDPSRHLHRVETPTLWVTGAEDNCYPLDTFVRSAALPSGPAVLRATPGLEHSHVGGWSILEPQLFFDEVSGGVPLPRIEEILDEDDRLSARLCAVADPVAAHLHMTSDSGPWASRGWRTSRAMLTASSVVATKPPEDVTAILSVTDVRGAVTSTPFIRLSR